MVRREGGREGGRGFQRREGAYPMVSSAKREEQV